MHVIQAHSGHRTLKNARAGVGCCANMENLKSCGPSVRSTWQRCQEGWYKPSEHWWWKDIGLRTTVEMMQNTSYECHVMEIVALQAHIMHITLTGIDCWAKMTFLATPLLEISSLFRLNFDFGGIDLRKVEIPEIWTNVKTITNILFW